MRVIKSILLPTWYFPEKYPLSLKEDEYSEFMFYSQLLPDNNESIQQYMLSYVKCAKSEKIW